MMARPMDKIRLSKWIAAAAFAATTGAAPALAQSAHQPFLQRDVPSTAWYYDNRDDGRDFQNNGFFPGDFAAHPPSTWIGAADWGCRHLRLHPVGRVAFRPDLLHAALSLPQPVTGLFPGR
jgi:hypothetical protein